MGILNMYQGLEDHMNGVEPGPGEEGQATEVAIAEVQAEINEAIAEVEQLEDAVVEVKEELQEHEETVEELAEEVSGLEAFLESGQYGSVAFTKQYNRCVKLNAKLGGASTARLGAESVSDAATARLASVQGIEGFMETVKAGANKAVEFIKHIFNTVINFFVGMVSVATGLERRMKMLEGYTSSKQVKEEVTLGSWNVGVDYEANGFAGVDNLVNDSLFKITHDALPAFLDLGNGAIAPAAFKTAYKKLIDEIRAAAKDTGKVTEKGGAEDKRTVLGTHAGLRFFAVFDDKYETDAEMLSAARSVKVSFGKTEEAKKFASGKKVKAKADVTELRKRLGTVKDYIKELRESKVQQKFSKAQRDKVIGTLSVAAKTHDAAGKEANKNAIPLVKAIYGTSAGLTTTLNKLYAYLGKQILDAVAAHL